MASNLYFELLERLKTGDLSAFEHIYSDYSSKVYRFARRYLNRNEDAEEIVQDVFVRLWDARMLLNPKLNFDNYLFTITRHLIINRYRRKVNEVFLHTTVFMEPENMVEHDVEAEIIMTDMMQFVDKIVQQFPPRQQEIFDMSRKQMLSHKEIAVKLDISEKTVKAHIYQVLNKIREHLDCFYK